LKSFGVVLAPKFTFDGHASAAVRHANISIVGTATHPESAVSGRYTKTFASSSLLSVTGCMDYYNSVLNSVLYAAPN